MGLFGIGKGLFKVAEGAFEGDLGKVGKGFLKIG